MKRVAFWFDRPTSYSGGLNYIRNLIFALSTCTDQQVEPILFLGKKSSGVQKSFQHIVRIETSALLDEKSPLWFLHKVLFRLTGSLFFVEREMRRHHIDVVSHADDVHGTMVRTRVINWIPDLQYLHLPELFPGLNPAKQNARVVRSVRRSDKTLVSSQSAYSDLVGILPVELHDRVRVLPFVSQPASSMATRGLDDLRALYGLNGDYFFLPNQFWQHKNHRCVFEAVAILRNKGLEITVVCTGNVGDFRTHGNDYFESLKKYLQESEIQDRVRILGVVPYADVLALMQHSLAVLNPSRFEGWSSSVEEAKSMGMRVILSDIPVHNEQAVGEDWRFFPPDDPGRLAEILEDVWSSGTPGSSLESKERAQALLERRTRDFGTTYQEFVLGVCR